MEAMRCLKRRLSDVVYQQMHRDARTGAAASPGGQAGATLQSSAADPNPKINTLEQRPEGLDVSQARRPRVLRLVQALVGEATRRGTPSRPTAAGRASGSEWKGTGTGW